MWVEEKLYREDIFWSTFDSYKKKWILYDEIFREVSNHQCDLLNIFTHITREKNPNVKENPINIIPSRT